MKDKLIEKLLCPFCGGDIKVEDARLFNNDGDIAYGTVRCECGKYPIIDGILYLKRTTTPPWEHCVLANKLVSLIEHGGYSEALALAIIDPYVKYDSFRALLKSILLNHRIGKVISVLNTHGLTHIIWS